MHFKAIVITVMALLLTMSVAQDTSALVPTFTGYAQKDCQDEIVRWAPGDVAADQCVIATGVSHYLNGKQVLLRPPILPKHAAVLSLQTC